MAIDDYSSALVAAAVLLICLITLSLLMRLYVRIGILGGLAWDDALITLGWIGAMGICCASIAATKYGFGKHLDTVPEADLVTFAKLIMICSTMYSWGVTTAKASFAVLYLRILQGRKLAILNKIIIVFLLGQALEETMVVVFQCRPIAKAWDSSLEGHCYKLVPMWWCTFVFNLSTDLTLFIQPIPSMWRLHLPVAKRIGIIVMLSLGLLVCIISVIRIVYTTQIGPDSTYELAEPMIWSMVEVSALVLCSCIPSLRQVIQKIPWLNHIMGLSSVKDSDNYYRSGRTNIPSGGASIALHSRGAHEEHDRYGRYGRFDSETKRNRRSAQFGMTSRAERGELGGLAAVQAANNGRGNANGNGNATGNLNNSSNQLDLNRPPSQDGSTDEIFPYQGGKMGGGGGAILVTRDIKHDVEVNADARTMYTEDSSTQGDERETRVVASKSSQSRIGQP
ncbi:hypothetical protein SPI_06513 [Niveomyces insectorum RCEF 264]|uniref:Rhodopsin domain-containing protein n=1 Tax=Niveomyces insectorum RCEF 264 TaxID=1081102 RepID=A0A167RBF0_9HYPO|nr:hypothetical protein SPI_06513 [Niveomyces insectorum RCEF 264]